MTTRFRVANEVMKLSVGDTVQPAYLNAATYTVIEKTDTQLVIADSKGNRRTYGPSGPKFGVLLLDADDTTPGVRVDGPQGRCIHCESPAWQDFDGVWLSLTDLCELADAHEVEPTNLQQAEVIARADPDD